MIATYLVALDNWPEDRARALAFCTLLASQPPLLLSIRSPERPRWARGQQWTRTVVSVIAVLVIVTLACVYIGALAELLHLEPFPPPWWLVVVAAASTAMSLEPLERQHR